jgi:hypothetical protein
MIKNQNLLNGGFRNTHSTPVGFIGSNMFNFTTLIYEKNHNNDYSILFIFCIAFIIFIYITIVLLNKNNNNQEENDKNTDSKNTLSIIPIYEMSHVCS